MWNLTKLIFYESSIQVVLFHSFWIEDHEMEVVEVDDVVTEKNKTNMLYITVAQRYSVLVRIKDNSDRNYALMQKYDDTMLDTVPKNLLLNQTPYMTYNSNKSKPNESLVESIDNFLDDSYLVPYQKQELLPDPDHRIVLDVVMDNLQNGINYAFFNNITYTAPKVPTLMTVLSSGKYAMNEYIYGTDTNTFVLKRHEVVEIILNNQDTGTHPFHLHGHVFQTVVRGDAVDYSDPPVSYNPKNHTSFPKYPTLRDTIYINPQSNFVIRFRADNPGVWFFHCHIEWHLLQGLAIVLIEDPEGIQSNANQQLTDAHKNVCKNVCVPIEGNAAGTTDRFNFANENKQAKGIPGGFTAKGYVAFVFSCVAGVRGLITITVYGLMDLHNIEERVIEDLDISPRELLEEEEEEEIEANHIYANSGKSGYDSNDKKALADQNAVQKVSSKTPSK